MPKKRSHRRASQKLLPLSAAERKIDAILPLFDEGETERALELLGIAAGFVNDLTADVEAAGRQHRFRIPDELALAARFDEALVLIENEHYKKTIDLLRPLGAQLEDSSSIRNALARTSWIVARCNAAVEAIGASDANDFIPLVAAGARYNGASGRHPPWEMS